MAAGSGGPLINESLWVALSFCCVRGTCLEKGRISHFRRA